MLDKKHGQHGWVAGILEGSTSEMLPAEMGEKLPERIAIFAPAGKGKTTAVAKLTYDWAHGVRGSPVKDRPLLFVVRLRDANAETSIGQEIASQLLSDVRELSPRMIESFVYHHQKQCYIVLDSLDEFKGNLDSDKDGHGNIANILRGKEYPECGVLVTSRPHLERDFNNSEELSKLYTKLELKGFSEESTREYVSKFFALFNDMTKGEELMNFLAQRPLMSELVSTPLFCMMISSLWNEGVLANIETQTALLESVNTSLYEHSRSRQKITEDQFHATVKFLGKIVLKKLLSGARLEFTEDDFTKNQQALEIGCEIGIISPSVCKQKLFSLSPELPQMRVEFYHKLAQEHVAGKYLAGKDKKHRLRMRRSGLDSVLRRIKGRILDYEDLLRFSAGTNSKICIRIMESILASTSLAQSEKFRILLSLSSETAKLEGRFSKMIWQCAERDIILESPTTYTAVGLMRLPDKLKQQVNFCYVHLIYTERQKKLITSSGRRSLKSTASILIIFGHK